MNISLTKCFIISAITFPGMLSGERGSRKTSVISDLTGQNRGIYQPDFSRPGFTAWRARGSL